MSTDCSTIFFVCCWRRLKALFAPLDRTLLPAFAMPALRPAFAELIAGVAAVDVPAEKKKAAPYAAPKTTSIDISAMPAIQESLLAEQARGPQFYIDTLALQSVKHLVARKIPQ